ncbi:rhodanese-like domain-containing protein 4, chloroplastic [Arachis duranensis]|uniref:Rhodanese-like domain-containing protein 4, chloroplastic n=1 Tax=Arachis duranensis TaxID=130453 RepID=A0A6P4B7Q3_ARADU|nr:rhodanese-like domain-containing protein 4, chloroplastic [Arachis duranensis]
MEAFNATVANLTPTTSVLSHRTKQPNKLSTHPKISACKVSNFSISRTRNHKKILFLQSAASIFSTAQLSATALTYEEALGQSLNFSSSGDFDANGVVENLLNFASENPLVVFGGVAVFAVPLVLFQVLKKPKPWGVESAKNAYEKLGADLNAQLLDIREAVEIREVGTPDINGLGKKLVSITYKGGDDDKPVFLKKLALKFKEPENTTLFILDKFDGNSELVAQLVTDNGFKAAYAIKDGAEGPRGWTNSGLPWKEPRKALDFGNLTEAISDAIGDTSDGLAVTLGIAAATGLGLLAFTEIETILQVLGSAALVQFASKKLLFAEDRKQTLRQLDEFLNTKVAPKELVDEVKQIGKAFLPDSTEDKALPEPTESSTVQKAEATIDNVAESKVDMVPETENKDESSPVLPRPQSPYPHYPDFKPPTSPTPSQP